MVNLKKSSNNELLSSYASIMDELRSRHLVRTSNNPVADYGEKIIADKLGLLLMPSSTNGYDAMDKKKKTKYQIKSRRLTAYNRSRQLGVIRNLEKRKFDYLAAVIFDQNFKVLECYVIPAEIIKKYSRFSKHHNGHILILRGEVLKDKRVKNLKNYFV